MIRYNNLRKFYKDLKTKKFCESDQKENLLN